MTDKVIIAIDAMGGDHGPDITVPAAIEALKRHPNLTLILVGQEEVLQPVVDKDAGKYRKRLQVQHASQVVMMDEPPSQALRGKKDSSMRVAINLVKDGVAQACVSAGNTGALMATSRFVLKTLPGIDRPAICTTLPTMKGHVHVLDLGANVDSSSDNLLEFAAMGSVLTSAVDEISQPTIGLLNVGEEEIKGNEVVKEAARKLSVSKLNYYGFVEGDDIYKGTTDVVVCDGFVGNVMLKTTEGVAKMISFYMKQEFKRNPLNMIAGAIALPVLRAFRKRIDPREYNGASLVGLNGIVVKSHGNADAHSFCTAIEEAVLEVEKNVPERIKQVLETMLMEGVEV
ncbi:MAG: phosphate acyltransferase PlsX [Gammaproteobacteria bacterium]|nr:phosphate acyltransferase PlsX [Gammaproteobacteria bacterium]